MAARVREEEKASETRQRKREAEEADKVGVALGVTLANLRRFRATIIAIPGGVSDGFQLAVYQTLSSGRHSSRCARVYMRHAFVLFYDFPARLCILPIPSLAFTSVL